MFRRHLRERRKESFGPKVQILVDLTASSLRSLRGRELPYEFGRRRFGISKLDVLVVWEYGDVAARSSQTFFSYMDPIS